MIFKSGNILVVVIAVLLVALTRAPGAAAWGWPVEGEVLRPFVAGDDPYAGGQHRGIDIAAPAGADARAAAAGVVSFAGQVPRHGLCLTIRTADGYSVTLVHLGSVGLIGSSAKWARFRVKLAAEGHSAEALTRIITPIGLPDLSGKDPATIAVSVAADLVRTFERERATWQTEATR